MIEFFSSGTNGFFDLAVNLSLGLMLLAFSLTFLRLLMGPTLPDRAMSLDLLLLLGIGFIGIFAISSGRFVYLDIAIALGLVGFLATMAFARYVERRGVMEDKRGESE